MQKALEQARSTVRTLEKRQKAGQEKAERTRKRADEKQAAREHRDDKARLKRLEAQNRTLYGQYRGAAMSLLALASVLRDTGGEYELLHQTVSRYTRAHGQPFVAAYSPRFPFPVDTNWLHYGLEDGLRRFLAWLRKCERVQGWG